MPALVCLIPPGVSVDSIGRHRHLGSRNVEIDRQQPGGPHQQVIGEDRIDGTDMSLPSPHQAHPRLDLLHIHVT